jgi:hypothetical protein
MTCGALQRQASAWLIMVVPVVVRMIIRGGSALTGRVGRHSTAGLAVVAAASLASAQLEEGIGRSHPQFRREGRVVGGPVGQQGPRVWSRPGFLTRLCHNATLRRITSSLQVDPVGSRSDVPAGTQKHVSAGTQKHVSAGTQKHVSAGTQKPRLRGETLKHASAETQKHVSAGTQKPRLREKTLKHVSAETSDAIAAGTRPA